MTPESMRNVTYSDTRFSFNILKKTKKFVEIKK